jgi:hypothetical protein
VLGIVKALPVAAAALELAEQLPELGRGVSSLIIFVLLDTIALIVYVGVAQTFLTSNSFDMIITYLVVYSTSI